MPAERDQPHLSLLLAAEEVASSFWGRYCWTFGGPSTGGHGDAAALTVGRHDFTAFTPTETEHVFFHQR